MPKNVKGFSNYIVYSYGKIVNTKTGNTLNPTKNNCGYLGVKLSQDGKMARPYGCPKSGFQGSAYF